jgi:hypothetical protein
MSLNAGTTDEARRAHLCTYGYGLCKAVGVSSIGSALCCACDLDGG